MSHSLEINLDEVNTDPDTKELYGSRHGTIFIVDATPPMFEEDPTNGVPYFVQSIQYYEQVLKQKMWRSHDWTGLILFGTNEWDMEPETKHILTVQKFEQTRVKHLKAATEITSTRAEKWKDYEKMSCPTAYPLHDVLWHAAQAFAAVKLTMNTRTVILFTCRDDPPFTDADEKHRIRVKAASYYDTGVELFVVGLGPKWNGERFYLDLEILSRKAEKEDYQRMPLEELLEQVKLPSRVMANLPWRIGGNVVLDVAIRNLTVKSLYLKRTVLSKETNVPLILNSYMKDKDDSEEEDDTDNEFDVKPVSMVLETEIQKYQEFGDERIPFTLDEVKTMCVLREVGIDLICLKPVQYHPLYHMESPYFVTCNKSFRKDNKLLFAALLDKCESKNLMAVCVVTMRKRSPPSLFYMIPQANSGGFHLYRIPYSEYVRGQNDQLIDYMYNEEKKPPTDEESICFMERIIKKLRIRYNPELFPNPKLEVQRQIVETLALDLEPPEPPCDRTLPAIDMMRKAVGDLLEKFDSTFDLEEEDSTSGSSRKRTKMTGKSDEDFFPDEETVRDLVQRGQIGNYTITQLKNHLKKLGSKTSGKKEDLVKRIQEHYSQT